MTDETAIVDQTGLVGPDTKIAEQIIGPVVRGVVKLGLGVVRSA